MRRLLVVVVLLLVLVLGAVCWLLWFQPMAPGPGAGVPSPGAPLTEPDGLVRRDAAKAPRRRTQEEVREEEVSGFFKAWPELGQDRPQDPSLGAIRGRVLRDQEAPAREAVVETSRRGELTARVRVKQDGAFLLRNVPPSSGVALTARAPGRAPGGLDKLVVAAGETLDVGAVYLGAPIDPDVTNRVEVRVVGPEDKPVAGAQVTATSTLYGALVALGAWEKQPGGTVVRETTDGNGVVVFDKLPPQQYDFFAEAPGFTFEVQQRYLVQRDTAASITLEVEQAKTIEGQVVDAEGNPIAKARVGVLRWNSFTMNPAVSTGDDGRFTVGGLSGGNYMLFAVKQSFGQKDINNVEAGTKDLVVTLTPGVEMALRVVDAATGRPVTSFSVRPFRVQPFAYLYSPRIEVSAADGIWRQQLPAQSWGVEVGAKGYAQKSLPSVPVPTKEPVEVKLDPAGVVHGKVVAKDGGRPVLGAKVYVKRGGFPPTATKDLQTLTDENGEFALDGLARAQVTIWIGHVDYTEQPFTVEAQARGEGGALPPAQEFALSSGGRIVGHAFGPGRKPLAGQTITAMKGAMDFLGARSAVVKADGSYEMRNVPPETYRVSVGGGFGGEAKNGVVVADGAAVTVDFGADEGGQPLKGRVVRDGDAPVANTGVALETPSGATQQATTDAAGKFAFENLAPGRYAVRGAWGRTRAVEVTVTAEEPPAEVTLTLLTGSIEGRVVDDATGEPVAGVWTDCEMTQDSTGAAPAQALRASRGSRATAADGVFRFGSLEGGRYRIRAYRDPYGTEMLDGVELAPGEAKTGVEVRLTSGAGALVGAVKTARGEPIEGAALSVKDAQGRRVFFISLVTSSSDGTYSQGQLKPGDYDATMEKDGFAPATQHVTIETGKPAKADFTLLQGGRIEVTARLDAANPAAGATVTVLDAAGRRVEKGVTLANIFSSTTAKTDANGQITIRGVAAGSYVVKVRRDDGAEASSAVDVIEGASAAVEIQFAR